MTVVALLSGDDEQLRRIRVAAEELADQPDIDRSYHLTRRATEIGVDEKILRAAAHAVLKGRAQRVAAERVEQERRRKRLDAQRLAERKRLDAQRLAEQREMERERRQAKRAEERERRRLTKEAERVRREAERVAQQKSKGKAKGLGIIARLPVARHERELQRLAARLGDDVDVAALRQELDEFIGVGGGEVSAEKTEPWPDPVDLAELLDACTNKISKHVVLREYQLTATALWSAHTWLYDHGVPTHSPILAATSAEPDTGKTTLIAVVGRIAPRFLLIIEMTGPSLYRTVDATKPTLVLDEADDLFNRRSDLKHIINAGWTRGAKIPRQVNIDGVWTTVFYDPFTPKAIALLGRNLPSPTRTRCIELRMKPKRKDEHVEPFTQLDDAEFAVLRRKFARWAADNATALKSAKPMIPDDLNNRAAANWKLLLAIAELAGGDWPERAHEAAKRLTRGGRRPSDGVRLLAAFREIFESGGKDITSAAVAAKLRKDPTSMWAEYSGGGAITQQQIALLLDNYDIQPTNVGPNRLKGYRQKDFADAFSRFLPAPPFIRSSSAKRKKSGGADRRPRERGRVPKRKV